jgi:hypothetical protein
MIKYTLRCADDHEFEGWFPSSAGYERQAAAGQITCPSCGNVQVSKAMMSPNVATSEKRADGNAPMPRELADVIRAVRQHVTENADYVGPRFAEEARKIHFGEVEPRGIYGEATATDAKALIDDGVAVCPLPKLPEEHN